MRVRVLGVTAAAALAAAAAVVAAAAETTARGLPSYTDGFQTWPRLNAKPFTSSGPLSSAHSGVKNVYASKRRVGPRFPNGTVIVKTIVRPQTRFVGQVAVMRKASGRWRFVEYTRSTPGSRYSVLAQGRLCMSCHALAKSTDFVFTKRRAS